MKSKERIYVYVIALFLVSINLRIGITSISPVLEVVRHQLGMSNFTVSFLTAIPVLCMGLFALFTGNLERRWGAEKVISLCLVIIGAATCMRAAAHSISALLSSALILGIGIAIAGPLLSGFIKKKFPNKIGTMIGVYSVGMGTGASLSAGLTVPLQHLLHNSWSLALASWSVLAIIALIVWYPILQERKDQQASSSQKNQLPLKSKKAWLFTLFFGLQAGIFYSVTTWLAPTAHDLGMTNKEAGTLITVFTFVQMAFSFFIPTLADYYKNRTFWLASSTLFVLTGLLLIVYPITTLWISSILLGVGLGGLFPLALMLPLNETKTSKEASSWTAMMQSGGYILGGIIPVLSGIVRDTFHTNTQVFFILIVLTICLLVLTVFMHERATRHELSHG
ncbi:CynX/NimT family MFS transporter [Priestia megaterium]|uniref:MFS transporter n=1 Tax=Priestia megaterium TaxID=1404 RepID=UPI002E246A37|nr:MFS transporter [Priestia megaterium]MED4059706.1 MFS transporter [Priestia megaterium]